MFNQPEAAPPANPQYVGNAERTDNTKPTATVAVIPLDQETRTAVNTATAAAHLNRRPSTLFAWSSKGVGPLKPMMVHGRLAWRVDDIRRLLAGGAQ